MFFDMTGKDSPTGSQDFATFESSPVPPGKLAAAAGVVSGDAKGFEAKSVEQQVAASLAALQTGCVAGLPSRVFSCSCSLAAVCAGNF